MPPRQSGSNKLSSNGEDEDDIAPGKRMAILVLDFQNEVSYAS